MSDYDLRPVFCGNFEYDARQWEVERIFEKYGELSRVDMKTGFAFVYMKDERDAEDAIRGLDDTAFGKQRRRLRVEWAKGDGVIKRREQDRRAVSKNRPSKTLFVVNFDPTVTSERDLEKHFEPYGKLVRVQIRKNFAFVQYATQEEATKAMQETNDSTIGKRVLAVEYAARDDEDGGSSRRSRSPRSDPYDRSDRHDRRERRRSPSYDKYRSRSPPLRYHSRSPDYRSYRR